MKAFNLEIIGKIEIYEQELFEITYRYNIKEGLYFLYSDIGASYFNKFIFNNYNSADDFRSEIANLFNTEDYKIILDI